MMEQQKSQRKKRIQQQKKQRRKMNQQRLQLRKDPMNRKKVLSQMVMKRILNRVQQKLMRVRIR